MNLSAILRRHLAILRLVQPPYSYPSKVRIRETLLQEDLDEVSERTLERDIKDIASYYGIEIVYNKRYKGYHLYQPDDEDLSNFSQFMNLLERSERLAFLVNSKNALDSSKYLLLEETEIALGSQQLAVIWQALRSQRQLRFQYQSFKTDTPKEYKVDPIMLLEYRNRWYLAARDHAVGRFKTFGLERMSNPRLSRQAITQDRREEFLEIKQDGLGVSVAEDQQVALVRLRVCSQMSPYLKTVPLHHSQTITEENGSHMEIALWLIINPELENAILGYGEFIEVLSPGTLRESIRQRATKLAALYTE